MVTTGAMRVGFWTHRQTIIGEGQFTCGQLPLWLWVRWRVWSHQKIHSKSTLIKESVCNWERANGPADTDSSTANLLTMLLENLGLGSTIGSAFHLHAEQLQHTWATLPHWKLKVSPYHINAQAGAYRHWSNTAGFATISQLEVLGSWGSMQEKGFLVHW